MKFSSIFHNYFSNHCQRNSRLAFLSSSSSQNTTHGPSFWNRFWSFPPGSRVTPVKEKPCFSQPSNVISAAPCQSGRGERRTCTDGVSGERWTLNPPLQWRLRCPTSVIVPSRLLIRRSYGSGFFYSMKRLKHLSQSPYKLKEDVRNERTAVDHVWIPNELNKNLSREAAKCQRWDKS